jgi:hypothetical protein
MCAIMTTPGSTLLLKCRMALTLNTPATCTIKTLRENLLLFFRSKAVRQWRCFDFCCVFLDASHDPKFTLTTIVFEVKDE